MSEVFHLSARTDKVFSLEINPRFINNIALITIAYRQAFPFRDCGPCRADPTVKIIQLFALVSSTLGETAELVKAIL